jgi:transposase
MGRSHGRAEPGKRVKEERPVNTPENTTVIGALGAEGMVSCLAVEGAADGEVFCRFIEEMLAPNLKPGQVVLMDNVPTHKSKRIEKAIEQRGAGLVYVPAYSPDLNPIDECWSKVKQTLRTLAARTKEKLMDGLKKALELITPEDIRGWFEHAGYIFTPE